MAAWRRPSHSVLGGCYDNRRATSVFVVARLGHFRRQHRAATPRCTHLPLCCVLPRIELESVCLLSAGRRFNNDVVIRTRVFNVLSDIDPVNPYGDPTGIAEVRPISLCFILLIGGLPSAGFCRAHSA